MALTLNPDDVALKLICKSENKYGVGNFVKTILVFISLIILIILSIWIELY